MACTVYWRVYWRVYCSRQCIHSFVNCVHTVHNLPDVTPNTVHMPVHCTRHGLATCFCFCARRASVLFPFLGECR